MRIAVLSDTHMPSTMRHPGELGGTLEEQLASADLILHGGDVTEPSVLDWCEQFAPVRCSLGGHDHFDDARCAPVQRVEHAGWRIGMVHDVEAIPRGIETPRELARAIYGDAELDVLIAGDSHYERLEYRDGVLLLDPASPSFPHHRTTRLGAIALLELEPDLLRASIVPIGETPGAPNPCTAASVVIGRGGLVEASLAGERVEAMAWRPAGAPPLRV
ncbi:MAG: metallophosphoesterase family protein [Chloroflexi bacterium]|nr:metallophosphoesterase family protein [Chloroflexota bacterium]